MYCFSRPTRNGKEGEGCIYDVFFYITLAGLRTHQNKLQMTLALPVVTWHAIYLSRVYSMLRWRTSNINAEHLKHKRLIQKPHYLLSFQFEIDPCMAREWAYNSTYKCNDFSIMSSRVMGRSFVFSLESPTNIFLALWGRTKIHSRSEVGFSARQTNLLSNWVVEKIFRSGINSKSQNSVFFGRRLFVPWRREFCQFYQILLQNDIFRLPHCIKTGVRFGEANFVS